MSSEAIERAALVARVEVLEAALRDAASENVALREERDALDAYAKHLLQRYVAPLASLPVREETT